MTCWHWTFNRKWELDEHALLNTTNCTKIAVFSSWLSCPARCGRHVTVTFKQKDFWFGLIKIQYEDNQQKSNWCNMNPNIFLVFFFLKMERTFLVSVVSYYGILWWVASLKCGYIIRIRNDLMMMQVMCTRRSYERSLYEFHTLVKNTLVVVIIHSNFSDCKKTIRKMKWNVLYGKLKRKYGIFL